MKLLVVILNYRVTDLTVQCLRALSPEVKSVPGVRVGVCENGTGPEAVRQLRDVIEVEGWTPWAYLREVSTNQGFTGGNNLIIREALSWSDPPEYVLLLNADAFVQPGALAELVQFMDAHPAVGIAGSRLDNPDGTHQSSGFRFQSPWSELDRGMRLGIVSHLLSSWVGRTPISSVPCPVDWVSGASMIVRRRVFEEIGLLDEGLYTYYDDIDICLRARRAGWPTWHVPQSRVVHIAGQSTGIDRRDEKPGRRPAYWFEARRRFWLKNYGALRTAFVDMAFLVGFVAWRARRAIQRKPDLDPPHALWDSFRHSVFCTGFAVRPVANPAIARSGATTAPAECSGSQGLAAPVEHGTTRTGGHRSTSEGSVPHEAGPESDVPVGTSAADKLHEVPVSPPFSRRRRLRHGSEALLGALGVGEAFAKVWNVQGAVILLYHSLADGDRSPWVDPRGRMSPAVFERQMRFLAEKRKVASLSQLVGDGEQVGSFPNGSVVITFDDGYLDTLTVAAPILARYRLPATLYLPTGYISRGENQWIDRLFGMFRARTRHRLVLPSSAGEEFELHSPRQIRAAYHSAASRLLTATPDARRDLLDNIESQLKPHTQPPRLTMNWDEVRRLLQDYPGFEIGAHTCEHVDLSTHGGRLARQEIEASIADIERELCFRPVHFAFPYDRSPADAREILDGLGLRTALASGMDPLIRPGADSYSLPRAEAPRSLGRLRLVTSGAYPRCSRGVLKRLRSALRGADSSGSL